MGTTIAPTAESAARKLERELRRAIIDLEIVPGARLSEQEIAERYGVSRQPVREALIGLGRTGLVSALPQRGTVVVKISTQTMLQARFVRESIESAVARQAALNFDPYNRARLATLLARQGEAAQRGDSDAFRRDDELFHAAIADGAGCPLAWRTVSDLKAHLDRACRLSLAGPKPLQALVDQHAAIVAAIDARDPDAAERAMRQHLTELLHALPEMEERYPEMFE
ncbi:GntR family transcriptional regulator [Rhodovastum atsumiense]|uniref:GntR family transcriptional regulator n=1 Tax=Rhodovastum atsumiense TaxID=504468 RepID=A0A5M6IUV5_9PROT|nr:GntR family transcriptional regulator [Rhodovastum atsumiense]KAA5612052.1 GntR family transcriptional regulator [Rhodovastum atsumiense]CAH2604081.1 GntR family transcriptional regulator [Rhodovastum atsumiense]